MKRDFDKFIAERRKKNKNGFTMFGAWYDLPPSIPYDAVLEFTALTEENKDEPDKPVANDKIFRLLESLIGTHILDSLRKHTEFDVEIAIELLNYALIVYGLKEVEKNQIAVQDQ